VALRQRIERLERIRGGRSWIEPAGEQDGFPMEAHVYEHVNGGRWAIVLPTPITIEEWTRRYAPKANAAP
jgi:hypothetical protein